MLFRSNIDQNFDVYQVEYTFEDGSKFFWYGRTMPGVKDEFSFHRSTDFEHVKAECRAVRGSVGISDTSSFAKYEITGPGAESWLSRMLANRIPRIGRMALTPMLNPRGKLIGDFTLARASADRFFLFGSGVAENYHMRWYEKHLPADGSVAIRALGLDLVGLTIAGPMARIAGETNAREAP